MDIGKVTAPAAGNTDFSPIFLAWSISQTRRPRLPASIAHIMPAAPAPIIMTS